MIFLVILDNDYVTKLYFVKKIPYLGLLKLFR